MQQLLLTILFLLIKVVYDKVAVDGRKMMHVSVPLSRVYVGP